MATFNLYCPVKMALVCPWAAGEGAEAEREHLLKLFWRSDARNVIYLVPGKG